MSETISTTLRKVPKCCVTVERVALDFQSILTENNWGLRSKRVFCFVQLAKMPNFGSKKSLKLPLAQ